MTKDDKIAVLLGGASKERDISLATGNAVAKALRNSGYTNVHEIDPSEIPGFLDQHWDRVFIALHGEGGEDGEMQRKLEDKNLPYTGTRSEASALAMSKFESKKVFEQNEIPTLPSIVSEKEQGFDAFQNEVHQKLTYPIIGKPDCEGSSIGMEIVRDAADLEAAYENTHQFGKRVLWENFLEGGIDLTVGILHGDPLPVIEIRPKEGLYDYDAKYTKGKTDYYCPARIDEPLKEKVQTFAKNAFESLGCRSWGRVDFIWKNDKVYCLEVNTVPGMTATSLVPQAAKQNGLSFEELVEAILMDAQ